MPKEKTVEGRIGSNVETILYRKLCEIARMFGRTKSDLLKEAIWELIQQQKQKQRGGGSMLYILNSLIIPVDFKNNQGYVISLWEIDLETARKIVREMPFTSAVGHEATAKVLTELLGVEIPYNRITVKMKEGDAGLHFVLRTRLPEGKVLNEEELRQLDFELVLSKVS